MTQSFSAPGPFPTTTVVTDDFDAAKELARRTARERAIAAANGSVQGGGSASPRVGAGVGGGLTGVRGLAVARAAPAASPQGAASRL